MIFRAATVPPPLLWVGLGLPLAYILFAYASGAMVYGAFIHWSGDLAAWLLLFTLALTPLRMLFPGRWPTWLLQRRRYFGVACFIYSLAHLGIYLLRQPWERVSGEALEPAMAAGWIAFAIFVALAVTSNDASVRALGRRWKSLHRWVYAGAVLTFAHWVMTAFDPVIGIVHCAVLAALLGLRAGPAKKLSLR